MWRGAVFESRDLPKWLDLKELSLATNLGRTLLRTCRGSWRSPFMESMETLTDDILSLTSELAQHNPGARLTDWLTVTRGYTELLRLDPDNTSYYTKLGQALHEVAELSRGVRVLQ